MKISDKTAYNLFLQSQSTNPDRELVLSKKIRRHILYFVVAGHIVFLILPIVMNYIQQFLTPKRLPTLTVRLIEEPKTASPPKEATVKAAPPLPPKPPRKIQETKPEPPRKQDQPKPRPQPEPRAVERKPVEKPPEKLKPIEKPKWTPIDPRQIKRSTEVVRRDAPSPPPSIDTNRLKRELSAISSRIKISSPQAPVKSTAEPIDYYDKVSAYLYELWKQPSDSELRGARPVVLVSLSVDASGRITSSSIRSKSAVQAMDASVENLLSRLSALPAPPSGPMTFEVSLEISD